MIVQYQRTLSESSYSVYNVVIELDMTPFWSQECGVGDCGLFCQTSGGEVPQRELHAVRVTALALCNGGLVLATSNPEKPAIVLPAADITSGHFSILAEPGGLRQWVSRAMGTYTAPTIAALSVLRPRGAPELLAALHTNGVISLWAVASGTPRMLGQLPVVPLATSPSSQLASPHQATALCAFLSSFACKLSAPHTS
jgi:hypothetical protein